MKIAVYCGSNPTAKQEFIDAAESFGKWIAESGNVLVYGGSSIGLMGAVSAAVIKSGGVAYGVEPNFFIEAGVAQHDLTELIVVETMAERKAKMIDLADVFVALPGGVGTLEEISEIMSRIRLRMTSGPCYFLNIDGFYDGMRALLQSMAHANFLGENELDLFIFCNSLEEIEQCLRSHVVLTTMNPDNPRVPEGNLIG